MPQNALLWLKLGWVPLLLPLPDATTRHPYVLLVRLPRICRVMKHKVSFCYLASWSPWWLSDPRSRIPSPYPLPASCLPCKWMPCLSACCWISFLAFSEMFLRLFACLIDESRDVFNVNSEFPDYEYLIKNNTQQHIAQVCAVQPSLARGQFDWFLCSDSLTSWLNKRLEEVFIYNHFTNRHSWHICIVSKCCRTIYA